MAPDNLAGPCGGTPLSMCCGYRTGHCQGAEEAVALMPWQPSGNLGVIIIREAESFAGLSLEQTALFIGLTKWTPQGPQLPSAALGPAGSAHKWIINSHRAGSDDVAYAVEPEAEK